MLRVWDIKVKSQTQIRFTSFWRKRGEPREKENQEKREPVESCNHQSKVRVRLSLSNFRFYNFETGLAWLLLEKLGFENWVFMWGSGKLFWNSWNLKSLIDYDRAKCQERVGENGIENGLTDWILRAKWWKSHFLKNWFLDLMLSNRAAIFAAVTRFCRQKVQ